MLSLNSFRGDQVWSDMFMEPSSICVGTMRDKVAFNAMNEEVEHCNYYEALGLQEAGEDGSVDLQVQSLDQEHEKPSEQILQHPIIWIDLEMTGLEVETDHILQIACIITDGKLKKIIEGEEIVVHHPDEVLDNMGAWCVKTHGKSGLTAAVRESKVTLGEAEARTLEFIQKYVPEPGRAPIAGNSIHMDVAFLKRYMPRITEYAHYRVIDVSTISELCRRWYPRDHYKAPRKQNAHTALSDIRESINQLLYYKRSIFKN